VELIFENYLARVLEEARAARLAARRGALTVVAAGCRY